MNWRYLTALMAICLLLAWVLHQPMVGLLLVTTAAVTAAFSRSLGALPWVVLALKLVFLVVVSLLVPLLWPEAGGLIPVNPDQYFYLETASRISEALQASLLRVDYAEIVGLHNRAYSVALGWLAFLNGGGSILLYRLFNVFLSMVLAALAYTLVRSLYPLSKRAAALIFLGVSLLPSVNLYSMFVLRDVMIATVLMLVVLGLFGQKFWVMIVGLALTYFTRIQLFFLLVAALALFAAMRGARRARRWAHGLSLILVAGFIVAGYFVAPFVLPPEYDYSHAMSILGFVRFLVHLAPSVLGLDFLFANPASLELGRSTLAAVRLLLFDTWLVPLLFIGGAIWYKKMVPKCREFYLWVGAVAMGYAAGYWITYGAIFVRLLVPLYPLFLLAAATGILSVRKGLTNEFVASQSGEA